MFESSVIVTGGRSPIALAIAEKLSARSKVILLTRNSKDPFLRDYPFNQNVVVTEFDMLEDSFIDHFQELVHEHDVSKLCFAHKLNSSSYSKVERLLGEVVRTTELIEELVRIKKEEVEKKVVLLTSPASILVVGDQDCFYHVNKASLSAIVRYFAVTYGSQNLAINALAPGSFVTKERSKQFYLNNPNLYQQIISTIPSRKFTTPSDISVYVDFLIHSAPITLNGTELVMDSGLTLIEQSKFARKDS
jgi:NAD(P)-dependent dehydrogenase (short-subunit alcohol dehydrogenase family)